jgi:hypothetical protein
MLGIKYRSDDSEILLEAFTEEWDRFLLHSLRGNRFVSSIKKSL